MTVARIGFAYNPTSEDALELRERDITVNGVVLAVDGPCAPNRIADAVAYLVGDEGHGLTGRMIRIDEFEALNLRRSP